MASSPAIPESSLLTASGSLSRLSVSEGNDPSLLLGLAEVFISERDYNEAYSLIARAENLLSVDDVTAGRYLETMKLRLQLEPLASDTSGLSFRLTSAQAEKLEDIVSGYRFDAAGSWASEMLDRHNDVVEIIPQCVLPEADEEPLPESGSDNSSLFWVSPNPGQGTVTLRLSEDVYPDEGEKAVTIYDVSGTMLSRMVLSDGQIEVVVDRTFPEGTYNCILTVAGVVRSKTVAIVN